MKHLLKRLVPLCAAVVLCVSAGAAEDPVSSDGTSPLWPIPPKNAEEQARYDLGLPPKYAIGFPDADGTPSPLEETPNDGTGEANIMLSPGSKEEAAALGLPTMGWNLNIPFTDVPEDAYYREAVAWAVRNGITNGVTDTLFNPTGTTTRGNVVTFFWRWAGETEPGADAESFSDVRENSYCYDSVRWAVERNVTKGTTASTFSPSGQCTYAHVLTFLWRFMGSPAPAGTGSLAGKYTGRYYQDAVLWAEEQGLLTQTREYNQGFSPEMWCPRADVVHFLYLMGRKSVEECVAGYSDVSLYDENSPAKLTMDMVKTADLWTYGTWNDRPGEHSRSLILPEGLANTLIWVVYAETPFTLGGLPSGGPLENVRITIPFNAITGEAIEVNYQGGPSAEEASE